MVLAYCKGGLVGTGSVWHFGAVLPNNVPDRHIAQSVVVSPSAVVNSTVDGPLTGTAAEYKLFFLTNKQVLCPKGHVDLCKFVLDIIPKSPLP